MRANQIKQAAPSTIKTETLDRIKAAIEQDRAIRKPETIGRPNLLKADIPAFLRETRAAVGVIPLAQQHLGATDLFKSWWHVQRFLELRRQAIFDAEEVQDMVRVGYRRKHAQGVGSIALADPDLTDGEIAKRLETLLGFPVERITRKQ